MYVLIKQKSKFVYRKKQYVTPLEIIVKPESLPGLVSQLKKQGITYYSISPHSEISVKGSTTKVKPNKSEIQNKIIEYKPSLDEKIILEKLNLILYKLDNLEVKSPSKTTKKSVSDNDTFIPEIDTANMNIKSKTKSSKSEMDEGAADALRQLLKGI